MKKWTPKWSIKRFVDYDGQGRWFSEGENHRAHHVPNKALRHLGARERKAAGAHECGVKMKSSDTFVVPAVASRSHEVRTTKEADAGCTCVPVICFAASDGTTGSSELAAQTTTRTHATVHRETALH